jgi:nucleoside-diphosphate-sugar epimerase
MPTRVLVTGAAGFIGSNLSDFLLDEGLEVIGIDNFSAFYPRPIKERNLSGLLEHPSFTFFEADIRKGEDLEDLPDFDLLVHLAAKAGVRPSIEDPQAYIDTNITGTRNLLDLCVKRGVKKIAFASSSSIYGNSKHIPFIEEGHEYEPISPYAFTKRGCELMNHTYHHLYDLDILNLRFFTVFGPRQRPDLAIHKFVRLMDEGAPIPMFGDGSTSRDYTFVGDTVRGIYGAMNYLQNNTGVFETVNLGNNRPISLKDMIASIAEVMGVEPVIHQLPMQDGDVNITYASIVKAKKLFSYDPQTPFEEGLEIFVDWYRSVNSPGNSSKI